MHICTVQNMCTVPGDKSACGLGMR